MRKAELGEKRRCLACSTAFFDLKRGPPIVCPKCAEVFQVIEPIRSSRVRNEGFAGNRWRTQPRGEAGAEAVATIDGEAGDADVTEESDAPETDDNILDNTDADEEAVEIAGLDEIEEIS